MNTVEISLKLATPKNKKIHFLHHQDFFSLELNGRTFSPQNHLQDNPFHHRRQIQNYTSRFDYQSRKFRVRSPSNFIKTAQNWKNLPYQRIKNVDRAIQISKKKQSMAMSEKGTTILPEFDHFSPSTSPKTKQKRFRSDGHYKMSSRTQRGWYKQNQQKLKKSINQKKQERNIIKFQQKAKSLHPKQYINNSSIITSNNDKYCFPQQSQRRMQKRFDVYMKNKSTLYAYIMKNRKKLTEKRQKKRSSIDYSLLQRIDYLQDQDDQNSVDLKIQLHKVKVKLSQDKQRKSPNNK